MSKQRRLPHLSHLLSYVGFLLLTVSAGAGQVGTTRPGEPVERHLSSDLTMREWTHKTDQTEDTKRIKVCRVETVCMMRYKEGVGAEHRRPLRDDPNGFWYVDDDYPNPPKAKGK